MCNCLKSLKLIIMVVFMMLSLPVLALEYYRVIDEPINVRSGSSKEFRILKKVYKDERVILIKNQGDWSNIYVFLPDGKKMEGWIHSSFIRKEATAINNDVSAVEAKAIDAHLDCIENKSNNNISSCLLDIDLTVSGSFSRDSVDVRCKAEMVLKLKDGNSKPVNQAGRIRTPLKEGAGAARMQLMLFPLEQHAQGIENVSVVDYKCVAK